MAIIISRAIGVDTLANRPAAATAGRLYFATDNNTLYTDTGAAWTTVLVGATTWNTTTSAVTAFDALAPTTTKGDIIVHDGTDNVRVPVAGNNYSTLISASGDAEGLEWRARTHFVTIFSHPTFVLWTPGAAYLAFSTAASECQMRRDLTPFREARIFVRASVSPGSTQVDVKIVDVDNTQDMTATVSFTSTTIGNQVGLWTSLNSATYADTNCAFEAQAIETAAGDALRVNVIGLELR